MEYWVIDGGSTDNTVEILKKYSRQLRWVSEPDRGQAAAINKGLNKSGGAILAYLNSDDVYLPGALQTVADYFNRKPQTQVLVGNGRLIDADDNKVGTYPTTQMDWSAPQSTCSICQPAVFWTKQVYQTIGGFNPSLHYALDYDYWLRTSREFSFAYTPTFLAGSRIHQDTKTTTGQVQLATEMIALQQKRYGHAHQQWWLHHRSEVLLSINPNKTSKYYRQLIYLSYRDILADKQWPTSTTWRVYVAWLRKSFRGD